MSLKTSPEVIIGIYIYLHRDVMQIFLDIAFAMFRRKRQTWHNFNWPVMVKKPHHV